MKHVYIFIFLVSQCYMQARLSFDNDFTYDNQDIKSGISLSYDKILVKQANVKFGLGLEYMFPRDIGNNTFKANGLYFLLRYIYEKKWSSYLRVGYNRISGIDNSDRNGLLCGFGVDYKLTDKWHVETGYHIVSSNEKYASRIACSISRHFKKNDDK